MKVLQCCPVRVPHKAGIPMPAVFAPRAGVVTEMTSVVQSPAFGGGAAASASKGPLTSPVMKSNLILWVEKK